ncbi:unnamed protein product [Caenorhabditis bovis]|uniref:Uncharacterized protein n=1 Tax=Caenorhabditis bovis TaxID=2654633 RepID=A0A8S1F081_9PELO|nr:unnamed protein product [Caenorhabditis bovis]
MNSNRFITAANIYYQIYFFLGIVLQSFILLLIRSRSPSSIRSLQLFLYNTFILQWMMIMTAYFTQHRVLQNSSSYAIPSNGPCKELGPKSCFGGYHVFMGIGLCVAFAISATILFRLFHLNGLLCSRRRAKFMIFVSNIPGVVAVIVPFTGSWNFETVRYQTKNEHPLYNLTIYEPYSGFSDTNDIGFVSITVLLEICAYGIPITDLVLARMIFNELKNHKTMSTRMKQQTSNLVQGLVFQTLVPLFCYIPIVSSFLYTRITGETVIITEHLSSIMLSFPGVIDPIISMYFIIPYRRSVRRILINISSFIMKPKHTTQKIVILPLGVENLAAD